jgi:glycosyltransferase involved in cell wall biosynthesis
MPDQKLASIVVPVYNGADTIEELVYAVASQSLRYPIEFVLVNDGSQDASHEVCMRLVCSGPVPVTLIDHARNFGEHNAVLTGLRHVNGDYVITMDDDLQNPPSEVGNLLNKLVESDADLIYGVGIKKQHALWRNIGSKFANWVTDWINDKPRGIYISTFRGMRRFVADAIVQYEGPYPFVDGLAYQVTNRVASVPVEHLPNRTGRSNYTIPKLVALWTTILVNFSVKPLHISIYVGITMACLGLIGAICVIISYFIYGPNVAGWASLVVLLITFTGAQLVILGVIGEYVGRMFLDLSKKPQAVIRSKRTSRDRSPRGSPKPLGRRS